MKLLFINPEMKITMFSDAIRAESHKLAINGSVVGYDAQTHALKAMEQAWDPPNPRVAAILDWKTY